MNEIFAGELCDARVFAEIRRKTILDGCKWDPQVGDVSTLAPFPLVMSRGAWTRLAAQAEQLTAEALAAETEIMRRPKLLEALGLPRALLRALRGDEEITPAAARVIRFDFHPTTEGWRISEANTDVPGGYAEGSFFTKLMANEYPTLKPAGHPGEAVAQAFAERVNPGALVALVSAPGFMEDHQVIAYVAKLFAGHGLKTILCNPRQIRWLNGRAFFQSTEVAAIFRFHQAEWLAAAEWFRGGKTPMTNPGGAAVIESKRFPVIWDQVETSLPGWRALLPETRDPREAPWGCDESWLLKTAFCNTGDTVTIRALMKPRDWLRAGLSARLSPNYWVAQRRFESVPIQTPHGPRHVCIGVYTVNGKAAGAYARLAEKPLINFEAVDAALLIQND